MFNFKSLNFKSVAFISLGILFSSRAFTLILLDDTMDRDEQKATGVYSLDHNQRAALELWLNKNFVLKTQENTQSPEELSLAENINNGQRLKLSDGSVYEIFPKDISRAAGWITPFPIEIDSSGDPNYPFKIINKNTGNSLKARQVSPPD